MLLVFVGMCCVKTQWIWIQPWCHSF